MPLASRSVLFVTFAALLTVAACSGGNDTKGGATPPENVSEADPEGVGGTSNQ